MYCIAASTKSTLISSTLSGSPLQYPSFASFNAMHVASSAVILTEGLLLSSLLIP